MSLLSRIDKILYKKITSSVTLLDASGTYQYNITLELRKVVVVNLIEAVNRKTNPFHHHDIRGFP